MTDIREAIARLTPHGVPLEMLSRSTAVAEAMMTMDWAMLLGYVEPRQAAMLLAKYTGDRQEEYKCRVWWRAEVRDAGMGKGWRISPRLDRMAETTMSEHLGRNTRCPACNGTKERMIANKPVMCPACNGAGFLLYSDLEYAGQIEITLQEFERHWRQRVDWCRRALYRWELDAAEALQRKL